MRAQNRLLRAGNPSALIAAVMKLGEIYRPAYVGEVTARLRLAATTDRPFLERITQFWSNHFAVSVDKAIILGVAGSYEREAIRPNVLGSFQELLMAVERHPAMLLYLDNYRSVGPDSMLAVRAQERAGKALGINENLAREIMELHTLGVDGGYTQADVTAFAKVITGWSIGAAGKGIQAGGVPGEFFFRTNIHEPGAQSILGRRYSQDGLGQGQSVLADLAHSPATARHIATQLARHFIADDPPPESVNALAQVFHHSGGDLPALYRALIAEHAALQDILAVKMGAFAIARGRRMEHREFAGGERLVQERQLRMQAEERVETQCAVGRAGRRDREAAPQARVVRIAVRWHSCEAIHGTAHDHHDQA